MPNERTCWMMEHVTELHRKSLIRLRSGDLERHPRTEQRGVTYGAEVGHAVRVIAESLDDGCAERLTPNLAGMAEHRVKQGELMLSPERRTQSKHQAALDLLLILRFQTFEKAQFMPV